MPHTPPTLYALGHSNITLANFFKIIEKFKINCLVDIRSVPYASYTPHFNKENLQLELSKKNIHYLHFKEEFGARAEDKAMYQDGQVSFQKMTERPIFKRAVARLRKGMERYTIALMCACAHPLYCHGFFMVCHHLVEQESFSTRHIFPYNQAKYEGLLTNADKAVLSIEENGKELKYFVKGFQELKSFDFKNLKAKSLKKHPLKEKTLFESGETEAEREAQLKQNYLKERNKEVGYKIRV